MDGSLVQTDLPRHAPPLDAEKGRSLMLIKIRWWLISFLAVYGLITAVLFKTSHFSAFLYTNIPLLVIFFFSLVFLNAVYHYLYRNYGYLRVLSHIQAIVDIVLFTAVIHFTGGVLSWGWVLYPLVVMEAALILDHRRDTWIIAGLCILVFAGLLILEYTGIFPPVRMPIAGEEMQREPLLYIIFGLWVTFITSLFAFLSAYLVGDIRDKEEKLHQQVIRDSLTDLYNRRYFFHRLNGEIQRCQRYERMVSVIIIDLDNFKFFNDYFGHLSGDELLQKIAEIFKKSIRRSVVEPMYDVDIPCRYGGDEFTIIMPESSHTDGIRCAERIRDAVASETALILAEHIRKQVEQIAFREQKITVSIGVASYPGQAQDSKGLVQAADRALYRAKSLGGNRVVSASELPHPTPAPAGEAA